jgi:hypothetical protein
MENSNLITVDSRSLMEQIREDVTARVIKKGGFRGVVGFVDYLAQESVVVWLEYFPEICADVRRTNKKKMELLKEIGTKGKFTDTYGWSPDREFKFEYEYTPELYFFMTNYVYAEFFASSNKNIHNRFMKRIMKGDDAIEALMEAKQEYGNNKQQIKVTN